MQWHTTCPDSTFGVTSSVTAFTSSYTPAMTQSLLRSHNPYDRRFPHLRLFWAVQEQMLLPTSPLLLPLHIAPTTPSHTAAPLHTRGYTPTAVRYDWNTETLTREKSILDTKERKMQETVLTTDLIVCSTDSGRATTDLSPKLTCLYAAGFE